MNTATKSIENSTSTTESSCDSTSVNSNVDVLKNSINVHCEPIHPSHINAHFVKKLIPPKRTATKTTKKNTVIFHQGNPLTEIYTVTTGVFKLCQLTLEGEEKIIGLRFPGELIGEDALYLKKYNYTAIAVGDSSVSKLPTQHLNSYGKPVPEIQQCFIELLNRQNYIREQNRQAYSGKRTAESLLASFILNILMRSTDYNNSDDTFTLALNRTDIADFLGLRRETLSRIFSKFHKNELIQLDGKTIQVINPKKLSKLAEC